MVVFRPNKYFSANYTGYVEYVLLKIYYNTPISGHTVSTIEDNGY